MKKLVSRKEEGFTLIEIIAVLVLLGILAVVAIPKFMGMQATARDQAALAAVAEGGARVSQQAAKLLLLTGNVPSNADIVTSLSIAANTNAGDFSLTFAVSGTSFVNVQADGKSATAVSGGTANKDFGIPEA